MEEFKGYITPDKIAIPGYIYIGDRRYQIPQTRMRLRCSNLLEDLFNVKLAESPLCKCIMALEDAEHYLKDCVIYAVNRRQVLVKHGVNLRVHETEEMLEGDPTRDEDYKSRLFYAIQD